MPPLQSAFRLSVSVVVLVIAVGLLLWWSSTTHTQAATSTALGRRLSEPQDSSQAGGATRKPSVNLDVFSVIEEEPPRTETEALPCAEQEPTKHRSLPNGSRIIPDSGAKGYGVFDVQNGTGEDAVLSLYDPAADETIRDVYVQARRSVRMKEIPEGTYQLAYTAALIGMVAKPFSAVTEHSQPDESAPHPIHNFDIFSQNQGLWAASYSSKSLIFLVCLH